MALVDLICEKYNLEYSSKEFADGTIVLQNDGDGDYIKEWNYDQELDSDLQSFLK